MSEFLESVIEKVSSYNIFNYLLPGAVFAVALENVSKYRILGSDVVVNVVVAYFVGMVLSRIGSLILEPFLKCVRFLKYCEYSDFVAAEKSDPKLATLSEGNNTYRTMTALFVVLLVTKGAFWIVNKFPQVQIYFEWAWPAALLLLLAFSYRKQTAYIVRRVAAAKK